MSKTYFFYTAARASVSQRRSQQPRFYFFFYFFFPIELQSAFGLVQVTMNEGDDFRNQSTLTPIFGPAALYQEGLQLCRELKYSLRAANGQ